MTTLEQPIVEPQQSAVLTRPVRRVELAVPLHSILRDADDRRAPSFPRCGDLSIVWTNRWLAATVLVGGPITTAGPALAAEYPGPTVPPASTVAARVARGATDTHPAHPLQHGDLNGSPFTVVAKVIGLCGNRGGDRGGDHG